MIRGTSAFVVHLVGHILISGRANALVQARFEQAISLTAIETFPALVAHTFVSVRIPQTNAIHAWIRIAVVDQLITIGPGESVHTLVAIQTDELWFALVAIAAHKVAQAHTKVVVRAVVYLAQSSVGTCVIGARVLLFAICTVILLSAVAFEIRAEFGSALAVVQARSSSAWVVCFALCSTVSRHAFTRIEILAHVFQAGATIQAATGFVEAVHRVGVH